MKSKTLNAALLAALALLTAVTGCSPIASAAPGGDKTPVDLDGTSWTLIELNGQATIPGSEITLSVDGDQLAGTAGCNRYSGSVTFKNGVPSVGMVGSTEMWCGAPEGVMDQESDYLQALGAVAGYRIEPGKLTLFDADGAALLVFGPESRPSDEGETTDGADAGRGNVTVEAIELLVMESFPVQVAAIVRGNLRDGCVVLDGISVVRNENRIVLEFETHREGDFCTQALVPFEERVTLDVLGLRAGTYAVRAGDVSAEFTLPVDNGLSDDEPVGNQSAGGTSLEGVSDETVQDLRGTVTAVELGADGVQVTLVDGEATYSVTISALQAEVYGRWEEIVPGAELVVSGPILRGMEPALVIAVKVTVVGSDSDYVSNLHGTVTGVEPGPAGFQAEIRADDGTDYRVTFDPATTQIVYLGGETELQVGAPVQISGELFTLLAAQFSPRIAAEVAVVQPVSSRGTVEG
jgi:inhibitor of cysteine peptidase